MTTKKENKKIKSVSWERVKELHAMVWKFGDEIKTLQYALQEQLELHKEKNEVIIKLLEQYLKMINSDNLTIYENTRKTVESKNKSKTKTTRVKNKKK